MPAFKLSSTDFIKYCAVSGFSFTADYLLVLLLLRLGSPAFVALAAGALTGCFLGYAGLELWAFRRPQSALNIARFLLYSLGILVMLLARAVCLNLFDSWFAPTALQGQALILALAYVSAFVVNYFFQTIVVFHIKKRI